MTYSLPLVCVVALAACAPPDTDVRPLAAVPDSAAATATADPPRAEAAGLSADQAAALERLGVPVYVPTLPAGWTLAEATTATQESDGALYPEYMLRYQTPAGTCVSLEAASEGLGSVFMEDPPDERDVATPGVPSDALARLGWSRAGGGAQGWTDARVASEWFGTDGLALRLETPEDCAPVSPDEAAAFLAALRPLDPADDALLTGLVQMVDLDALPSGPDPEALARAAFGPTEPGEGREQTTVETLRRRDRLAVVLVTTTDQADDSVRDTRTRVTLALRGATWEIVSAGTQQRCQSGRGHAEWSAATCR